MVIIYAYKFVDDKLDVFEAELISSAVRKADGSFYPSRSQYGGKDNIMMVKYSKCILNSSGKGITQYNKRCVWLICKPEVIYRNVMWLPDYDLKKAAEIFRKYNNDKIAEYERLISELKESNKVVDNFTALCNHKYPNSIQQLSNGQIQCKVCGSKWINKSI